MWYTTEDARRDATKKRITHFLKDGFTTACGLSRHFSVSESPNIAVIIKDVTCNKCKESKEFHDWKNSLIKEGIYKNNEDA